MVLLQSHYRSPITITADTLDAAVKSLAGLDAFAARVSGVLEAGTDPDADVIAGFHAAMEDDLDTPRATALLFDTVRRSNAALDAGDSAAGSLAAAALQIADTFGLELGSSEEVPPDVLDQAAALDAARARKDFAAADAIRAELQEMGWTVETGKSGTTVRR
jgi:cysteinyl-tRNA synthetase